jgi:ASC-1-like (ASCH) protein
MLVKQLSEPWFSLMYCGKKSIEIALDKGHFHDLKSNDISKQLILSFENLFFILVEFFNDDLGFNIRRKFCVRVLSIEQFVSWESLLDKHLSHALPTIKSIEFAEQIFKKLFPQFDDYKKLAIHIKRVSTIVNVSTS